MIQTGGTEPFPPLILASSSATRQSLLRRLGLPFTVASPDIDETELQGEGAEALVLRLAEAKAEKVASVYGQGLIIGADQVGVLRGKVLGKPLGHDAAVGQLLAASGDCVRFLSAVCLLDVASGRRQLERVTTAVHFRTLDPEMVQAYIRHDRPFDCAGSFRSEGLGVTLIDSMESEDPTAILGLPLIRLVRMLENEGVRIPMNGRDNAANG